MKQEKNVSSSSRLTEFYTHEGQRGGKLYGDEGGMWIILKYHLINCPSLITVFCQRSCHAAR